jgi:hypothetical protein
MDDLYPDSIAFAYKHLNLEPPTQTTPRSDLETVGYWAAWYAARTASTALLDEAKAMNLTPEQVERLRGVAERVAYD